jgi:hypothetical protein
MSPVFRAVLLGLLAATPAGAQTATVTLSANLGGLARLSLSTASLSFPDADPDTVAQIQALPAQITITAKARATERAVVTLTVQAADDLRSGVDTIPADALTWTAAGPGFTAGAVSRAAPQPVASWIGSGVHVGTQSYLFRNSWSHAVGTYSLSLLYTLSSP